LQEFEPEDVIDFPISQLGTWLDTRDSGGFLRASHRPPLTKRFSDDKCKLPTMYEDKENENAPEKADINSQDNPRHSASRRMSLLKSVLGLKLPRREFTHTTCIQAANGP